MSSATSVNLGVWSLRMTLILHLALGAIGSMSNVVVSWVDHSNDTASLTAMCTMHLH
jgi:hypothetical protein